MASLNFTFFYQNLAVDRIWTEINARVNYHFKKVLVETDHNMKIDTNDYVHKFCVSAISCLVDGLGLSKVVQTQNSHFVPGIHPCDTSYFKNQEN